MAQFRKEFAVGCLVIFVFILMGAFAWLMGVFDPFAKGSKFYLLYSFAGGVEIGSPVRVSGVKVGKVDRIEFIKDVPIPQEGEDPVTLQVTITVSEAAAPQVRADSKFYVNMAGIIGERYIEVSPGNPRTEALKDGAKVRGIDPPRIDQLLSQGYDVFGKIQEFIDENHEEATVFIEQLQIFLKDANKILSRRDVRQLGELIQNLNGMTSDLRTVTSKLKDPRAQEILDKLGEMIDRGHQIDKEALKKFLQEEGVRARIF